jgi:hypothetical protein
MLQMDYLLIVVPLIGLMLGILFLMGQILDNSHDKAWQEFAAKTGLKFRKRWHPFLESRVDGIYRGYPVSVDAQTGLSLKIHERFTVIKVVVKNAGNNFLELDKGWINTNFLVQKFQTEDAEFDRRIYTTTNAYDFAKAVLSSVKLRESLQRAIAFQIVLRGNELILKDNVVLSEINYLTFLLNLMTDLAKVIDTYQTSQANLSEAVA